ncbi:hypothetical protein CONPUDRAFT_147727 [Coniophora puteana RWD-64-598 SS2]|uniref:F-box domain-containing protein n=1 Tax=Coniophora puteana (strain RWD-64-598) TaxID=741705 RepID=R7SH22_CONPW|nr:uncharacterized protein CONPUDRAFT_147727 [Coniophora puteana RWD-64-598 SS2]EIW74354.1 hypothetical protein CONPUDRAFT_147727 [Coniophora puteana RWD-64-598 SS2]
MHDALLLPEVRDHIFDYITQQDTLAALARTCTAFLHHSRDRLWSGDLDPISMVHLQHIVSQTIHRNEFGEFSCYQIDLQFGSQEDWDYVLQFTTRVRRLYLHCFPPPVMHESALLRLVSPPSGLERVFPKLRYLVIDGRTSQALHAYTEFFSPQLVSFKAVCNPDNGRMLSDSLPERSRRLQILDVTDRFSYDPLQEPLIKTLSVTVVRLPLLSELRCSDLEPHALLHISRSSYLRHLVLSDAAMSLTSEGNTSSIDRLDFPALERLELSIRRSMSSGMGLLRRLRNLPKTQIMAAISTNPQDVQMFLSGVAQIDHSGLEELLLSGTIYIIDGGYDPQSTLTFDYLVPLLQLDNLRSLSLGITCCISMTLEEVTEIARALHHLRRLHSCLQHLHLSVQNVVDFELISFLLADNFPLLANLTLEEKPTFSLAPTDESVFLPSVKPLLRLRRLTTLILWCLRRYMFTDADMKTIAQAFPRLTRLELHGRSMDDASSPHPLASFDSVLALTELCPDLSELRLQIDACHTLHMSSLEQWLNLRRGAPHNRTLTSLDLRNSHIQGRDAVDIMILLVTSFERLASISLFGEVRGARSHGWMDEKIRVLRQARKERDLREMSADELRAIVASTDETTQMN